MNYVRSRRLGFSLIEVVVYVSLFSLISLFALDTLIQTVTAFTNLRISRDINDSSAKIMERMTRDIRGSRSIDITNSTFGSDPGRLTLATLSASGTPMTIEYFMSGNALHVREDGVDKGSLLSSQTSISGVLFNYINTGTTIAVKIDLHVTASRGSTSKTEHFYNTIIMRGSY